MYQYFNIEKKVVCLHKALCLLSFCQMGLIPSVESIQDCSQKTLQPFHCTGLAISPDSQESLPEVCERLIKSLSARIHYGATGNLCNTKHSTAQN